MPNYIDGFVFPLLESQLNEYKPLAEAVATIWKEHGALDYVEYLGDDLSLDGTRSFIDAIDAKKGEVIIFGWVVFESRQSRDLVNEKVENDVRMADLINSFDSGFDAKRMAHGGFKPFISKAD